MSNNQLNSYELSRNFFDWCFENPEKISPSHSAIYFFAIEHCNRLGWKTKFGFPTQMVMDAIGIKKHETYIRYLNDLIEWGFLILIQKSTNQYSSNIISISNAIPKKGKALGKATKKHNDCHTGKRESTRESKGSILKQENQEQDIKPTKTWRDDFEIYKSELRSWFKEIENDKKWISLQERYNPNVDILLSIEKGCSTFWGTEAGWKNKKKSKTIDIDWKQTFANNIEKNKVYKPRQNEIKYEPTANYKPIQFNKD